MIIYESEFSFFDWDENNSIFAHSFKSGSKLLTNDLYKKELLAYVESFEQHKPLRALVNNQLMAFTIAPSLQDWHAENVFPRCIAAGVKKAAMVITPDLFAQVSLEQLMDEEKSKSFELKFFDSEDEALKWLMQ